MLERLDLLQLYFRQEYDLAAAYPKVRGFIDYWVRELDGALHLVRVARHGHDLQ
jgi:uncharacterized protein Usg